MSDLKRIAEIEKNAEASIVFSTTEYRGETYIDVREHVKTATYTGFTKKGIRFHHSLLDQWIDSLAKVKAALDHMVEEEQKEPQEESQEESPEQAGGQEEEDKSESVDLPDPGDKTAGDQDAS